MVLSIGQPEGQNPLMDLLANPGAMRKELQKEI